MAIHVRKDKDDTDDNGNDYPTTHLFLDQLHRAANANRQHLDDVNVEASGFVSQLERLVGRAGSGCAPDSAWKPPLLRGPRIEE